MNVEPQRILITTQGPFKEPFKTEIENLFRSINIRGGKLKEAKKIAVFSEPVDADFCERLERLGARIKIEKEIDDRCPHASKIQMLNVEEFDDFDYLIALDADVIICEDFTAYLDEQKVCAKPVDGDPLSLQEWNILFEFFGLDLPQERYTTHFHMKETIPYFNSGVILIPRKYVVKLYHAWKSYVYKLLESYDKLPEIKKNSFFTDQFAFALALQDMKIPHNPLPLEMNFPTHMDVHENNNPNNLKPKILHYHHKLSNGKIQHCSYENINKIIDDINDELSKNNFHTFKSTAVSTKNFDNREFWDNRYKTNPSLGSGVGSRGKYVTYKQEIIRNVIKKYDPETVLDVGCGDLEIVKDLPFKEYTGIDISKSIIEKNKKLRPNWNFLEGNLIDMVKTHLIKAEFVLCFDVLIHQHVFEEYVEFVNALVSTTKKAGIVSGYEWFPDKPYRSEITAYHEPLSKTLKDQGARNIRLIGEYRQTAVFEFLKNM